MWQPYVLEARYELVKMARLPTFAFMTLAFPLLFYLLFGVVLSGTKMTGGLDIAAPVLATIGTMGVVGACLFGLGMGVALERAQGWFLLKRATPMRPLVYVTGKTYASMAFAAAVVVSLCLCATLLGGVHLAAWRWALLATVLIIGSAPFCAIGAALGFLTGPNAAPAVINFIHLPAAFASGLWMPLELLPRSVGLVGQWLPQYHLGQLALAAVGLEPRTGILRSIVMLVIWMIVGTIGAVATYRRDEGKRYG